MEVGKYLKDDGLDWLTEFPNVIFQTVKCHINGDVAQLSII